jgi:hypothetical protein
MRTIIAGSRSITDYAIVEAAVSASGFVVTEVLCGGAAGADELGAEWGRRNGVPVRVVPADWKRYGRAAGPKRNAEMVAQAEAVIAIWDGKSRGTADCIRRAQAAALSVYVHDAA